MLWRGCRICLEQVSIQSRSLAACQKKPRSIEELTGSSRPEHSGFFDTVRWGSGECSTVNGTGDERILRLICFRFDVEHISLPLGANNLEPYSNERERTAPEERGGWRRTGAATGACLLCDGLSWSVEKRKKYGGHSLMTELGPGEEEVCASGGSEGSRDAVLRNSACAGAAPKHGAPRVCQLYDAGFRDWTSLVQRCHWQHGGFNECRWCIFWKADRYHAQGMPGARKRYMVANTATAMVHARPQANEELEERRKVPCAVCARKKWLEERCRSCLWKSFPDNDAGLLSGGYNDACKLAGESEALGGSEAEEPLDGSKDVDPPRRPTPLRDENGSIMLASITRSDVAHSFGETVRIPSAASDVSLYRWTVRTRSVPTQPPKRRCAA